MNGSPAVSIGCILLLRRGRKKGLFVSPVLPARGREDMDLGTAPRFVEQLPVRGIAAYPRAIRPITERISTIQ